MSNITALASIKDAAKLLNVSTKTLRRWEARGLLVPVRTDGGHRRYEIAKIKELKGNKRHTRISQTFQQTPIVTVPQQQITVPVLYEGLHIDQKRILKVISGFALFSLIAFAIVKITTVNAFDSIKNKIFGGNLAKNSQEILANSSPEGTVLAATTSNATPKFNINIESAFKDNSLFTKNVEIDGDLTLKKQIIGNVDLTGVVIVGGNSITTSQNVFNLINTTASTLNIGGAATTLSLGATTGNTNVNNNLNVKGNSTITGSETVTGKITGSGDLAISGDATFGDITEINGATYSFPDSQGAASTLLTNDGSGNLTWTNPSIGALSGVLGIANGGTNNSTAYTAGSVIFSDGTSLTQDNSNFFWDNSGKQLGIGNAAPGTTLDVTGTGRFSGSLTASNGFTLTTGVLDLTSTSGTSNLTSTATSGDSFAFTNNSLSTNNSNLVNLTFRNANTGAGTIANGLTINATGATPSSLTNTENLINLGATALGSNTFTGINFGSGLSNYISSTNWTVTAAGAETIASDLGVNGGNITTTQTVANIFTGATTLGIGNAAGTTTINGILAVSGASNLNGNTTIGDAITDTITFNGRVAQDSDLLPIGTTGINDLGSASLPWDNVYATNFIQNGFNVCDASGANCPSGSVSYWDQPSGVLYPNNNTVDVLIGSNSTASAKISFTGINGGLPVASIAGNIANVATYLNGNGNLATTNAGDLTLGSSTTGNVIINSRGSAALTANGSNLTTTGTFSLPNSNTLTGVSNYVQASQGYAVGGNTTYFFDASGNLNANAGTFAGNLTANGDSTLGNAITDNITFTGRVAADSDLLPIGTTGVNDLGSPALPWDNVYAVAFTQNGNTVCDSSGNCPTGTQYWKLVNGTVSPFSDTLDVTFGASATASAKFAFTGVNSGTPTASIAGSTANVATYLNGNGNLSTTNAGDLTLGSSTTGNVIINSRGLAALTANGANLTTTGTVTLPNSNTITGASNYIQINNGLSVGGATTYHFDSTGNLVANDVAVNSGNLTTTQTTANVFTNATTLGLGAGSGTTTVNNALAITGALTANGDVTLGNAITDAITFTGRVAQDSDLLPIGTTGTNDLGSASLPWDNIYSNNFVQNGFSVCDSSGANCPAAGSGGSKWTLGNGVISPFSTTLDVLFGGTATTSAKFAFINNASGLPTASISGDLSNVATYLTGNGALSTTNAQDLTLGSSTTGNVVINSRGNSALTANGANLTTTGTITLPNSNTLTGVANYLQNSQGFSVGGGTTYYFDGSGNINANAGTFAGALTANGDVTFGNAITDAITFTGRVAADSDLLPIGTTGTNDLGSALLPWDNVYAVAFTQNGNAVCDASGANCPTAGSGGSKWKLGSGTISPFSDSLDVLIGSSATTSAKIAFTNILTGTPTASIAGSISNVATFIDGNGNISSTNRNNLTLGNSSTFNTTGNVLLNPNGTGNVGIGVTSPGSLLEVGGKGQFGTAPASSAQLVINGGASGADLIQLVRTSGATLTYGWSLGGNKMSFNNVTDGYTTLQTSRSVSMSNTSEVNVGFDYGSGETHTGDQGLLKGSDSGGAGTDSAGGNLYIASGRGTGASTGSSLLFQTPDTTTSGTSRQTLATRMTINGSGDVIVANNLNVNGNSTLGDTTADNITFTGRVAQDSDLLPIGTTGTNDLGSASLPWDNVYAVAFTQNGNAVCDTSGNCATVGNQWQLNNKIVSPAISSYDLAIGGTATGSAFQVFGIEQTTGDIAKLNSTVITSGNVFEATASAITSGNLLKLGQAGASNFTGNGIFIDTDNTGGGSFTGNFLRFDNAGSTKFTLGSTGVLTLANGETIDNTTNGSINIGATTLELTGGNTLHSNQTSFDLLNTTTTTLNIGNAATTLSLGATTGTSTVRNGFSVNGDTTLGDAITDNITFTGRVAQDADLLPITATGTNDLGSLTLPWDNVYGVAFTQNGNAVCDTSGNCATVGNQWQLNNKIVSPAISSYDLAIGGTATGSAFQVFGIEQTTGDIAKLNSTVITSGNVIEATASAITSGNLIKLGSGGNNGNFTGNAIFADLDNTGGSSFTGNFLKFDNATSTKFTVNSEGNVGVAAGSGIDTITAGALALGTGTASSVSISKSGVTTTVNGGLTSTETLTASNGLTLTTGALNLTSTSGTSSLTSTATNGDSFAFTNNSINTASGNLANFTFKNNNTGGAGVAVSGVNISATGSTPISGTNTENLINLSATALGSNTFNGINFGNGLTNYINGTNFSVTSAGAVTALGGLSASGGTVALNSTGTSSTTIGNTTGTTTFTGNILPATTNTSSLGSSSSLQFATIYANVFTQNGNNVCDSAGNNCPTGSSGGSKWKLANGAVSPFSDSLDVLIGSSATTSAKFAFTGVSSGTPTASIAGTTTNVATYINGNGNLSTTNMAALTLGSSTTGNVVINSRGSAALTANGIDLTAGGDLAVNGATSADITTTTTTATLFDTTATTLSLGGAATTALNLGNGTGNYTAINLGSGVGTHTINIAGTGATAADTINIGTGGTGADTINIGSNASTTALNLTSGTGSQTHLSSVATGTGLSAAFVFKDTALSSGDLIYATASGAITSANLFKLGTGGNTTFTGNAIYADMDNTGQGGLGFTGNFLKFDNATVNKFLLTSAGNIDAAGTASISGSLTFKTGASSIQTTASNALTIGGSTTGNITLNPLNAVAGGFVAPNTTNVTDLGTASLLWRNIYGTTIAGTTLTQGGNAVCDSSGANCPAGASIWGQALGAIYPLNNSEDLLIGSSATTSAKFAFTGVKSGTPTASISGTTANVATYLNGNGSLSTTNMANLTLGSATTGDVTINSRGSTALTANGANTLLNGIIYFANSSYYVDGSGNANLNAGTFAANISANSGTITTNQTTGNLFDTTATTLNLGGAATTALNLGNGTGNYSAINLGSGVGTHTINIAGTGATAADTINIGTGGTGADTINIGSNASTTALNLTSGTGAQTFASSVVSGTGTSGAFAFTANALTTGAGAYFNSSSITTGDLVQINATGTTLTTGFLLDVQNNSSSVFTVGASQITNALPTQFTAAGDVNIAYDLIFTNQTASTIDSYGPLTIRSGESFESNNLTFKTYNSGNVVFDQAVGGKVLIGTGSATLKFTVSDSQAATAAAMIENTYNGSDADGLAIKLGYTGNGSTTNRFLTFLNGVGNTVGRVEATTGLGVAYQTSGIDFAEYFTKDTSTNFEEGDIVSLSNSNAVKSGSESDSAMIGIVSLSPGFKGGNEGADKVLVGLVGQVPLKISPSSSPIKIGDLITSSNDIGRGKKATGAGFIIGKALENWNGQDKIMVYVSPTYADPNMSLTASGNLKLEQDINNPGYSKLTDGQGNTVSMLSGLTSLLTNTFNAFQGTVDNLLVKVGLVSPSVLTNTISPLAGEKDINIQVGTSTESGKLAIKNAADQTVAGIDSNGNATFSGSLHAGTIYADQIISRDAKFGDTSTNTLGGISRQEIEDLLTSVESDINMLNQSQNWSVNTATSSSSLNELNLKDLFVTGTAAMNSLSLSESLTLGTDMVISSALNSIDTLNNPLLIQASASQPLYIMAGKVQIDTTGNMQVLGNLAVGGVLSASAVNIAFDPNATVSANILTSQASAGQAVVASGSAELTILNPNIKNDSLIFVTPTSETDQSLFVKNESTGSAVIGFKNPATSNVKFNWWIVGGAN